MAAAGNRVPRRSRPAMRRAIRRLALAGCLAALPMAGHALGLGSLQVHSSLGEPLEATAPVRLGEGEAGASLQATLASESDYRMVGGERPAEAQRLRVKFLRDPEPHIRLSTEGSMTEPLMDVMVRVGGGGYQVLKQFTVALDPAAARGDSGEDGGRAPAQRRQATDSAGTRPAAAAPAEFPVYSAVGRPKVTVTSGWSKRNRYGPVRGGETLTTIVRRVRGDDSVPLPAAMVAVWRHNPDAFLEGNINGLREGAVLEMPSNRAVRRYSAQEAEGVIREQRAQWLASGHSLGDTRSGHQRYQVQVALDEGDGAGSSSKDAAGEAGESAGGTTESREGSETGAQPSQEGAAAASAGAGLDQLQERLAEQLAAQQDRTGADFERLQERVGALTERLEQQNKLIQSQSQTLRQLTGERDGQGGGGWLLWLLAGLNAALLGALGWVGWRLRNLGHAPVAAADTETVAGSNAVGRASELVARGQDTAARQLLWDALEQRPEQWAAYGSLLDLYERAGDARGFETVARRLFGALGERQGDWQAEVRSRGRALSPDSLLFAEPAASGDEAAAQPAFAETAAPAGPEPEPEAAPEEEGLVLPDTAEAEAPESGGEGDAVEPSTVSGPESASEPTEVDDGTLEWDLEWEPQAPAEPESPSVDEATEAASGPDVTGLELAEGEAPAGDATAEPSAAQGEPLEAPAFELEGDFVPDEAAPAEPPVESPLPETPEWELGEPDEEAYEAAGEPAPAETSADELSEQSPAEQPPAGEADEPLRELGSAGWGGEGAGEAGAEGTSLEGYEIDQGNEMDLKLDLASAFVDMDDAESARSLLEEVQSRGSAEQQDQARQLLQRLSG